MSTDPSSFTPEQAREQLQHRHTPLTSPRDRRVHAATTATFGVAIGATMALQNLLGPGNNALRAAGFIIVWLGAATWAERAARTVPRRTKLASRLGIGGSMLVSLTIVLPWLNYSAQTEPNTWPMVLAGTAIIALPCWVAAGYIAKARR